MAGIKETILAFMLAHGSAGKSVYSFESVPECGTNPERATCELNPVCEAASSPLCKPPRWSEARQAWVKVETRATAEKRWAKIASGLERTATRLIECRDLDGSVIEDCELIAGWPRGRDQARSLALAATSVTLWESGWREDIQFGHAPSGRGSGGEVCAMQIMPNQIVANASWLAKRDRQRAWKKDEIEQLAQSLLGDSDQALDRCFEVGMRILGRMRQACRGKGVAWSYGMFAMYGSGSSCSSAGNPLGDYAAKRDSTFRRLLAFRPADSAVTPASALSAP